jgi:hypothetical protein
MIAVLALAATVALAPPQPLVELDAGSLKGDLTRLAWSADGSELYVQSVERDRTGNVRKIHHALVSVAERKAKGIDEEPQWAGAYWTWKSGQASPAAAAFKIAVSERTETKRSVSAPTGGALARGGTADPAAGSTLADVASVADTTQTLKIFSLKIKDETIGEWTNEPVVPGSNFSWAPAPLQLIAFAKRDGGPIVVLDPAGQKLELPGTRSALLPAWSADGRRLAWIERKGKKYLVATGEVTVQ